MLTKRILSLFLCVLMMIAAALTVNHSIFRHTPHSAQAQAEQSVSVTADTVSHLEDGTLVIHTSSLTDRQGYAGPVPLDIYVKDGVVTDVKALPNAETPGFFKRAESMLEQWKGKTVAEAAAMKVDGVTGATYSSDAIRTNVEAGLQYVLSSSDILAAPDSHGEVPLKLWIALAVTLVACIVPLFVRNKVYHTVQLVANVAVLGFWAGQFLDYRLMLNYLSGGIPLPMALTTLVMLVAAFVYPLFGRPQHYCSHICPFGSAQQLVASVCRYKIRLSPSVLRALDWARRILWAVLMLLLWADVWVEWMDIELFQAFIPASAPVGIIIAAAAFVALSAVVSRPYCRFVCPTGSLFRRAENLG
ncbi:MAG: 4Fe-4S binding protein [Muribaculaceae bacterium]|nr:4Fe-4S binding protein [Muribaculaceae bacterium]